MELSQLMSDLTQHKKLLVIGALVVLYLAIAYLERYSKGKKGNVLGFLRRLKGENPQLKDNTLNIDVRVKEVFRYIIVLGALGLNIVLLVAFPSNTTFFALYLVFFVGSIYAAIDLAPGFYKNGKYLGTVYTGFIKVGNSFALGKKRGTETIGALKILRNGRVVAELHLTAEGFMELSPDKISEVFPEIKGKVEKFKGLFRVGDYTLQYSFFQKTANASYQGTSKISYSSYDDAGESSRKYSYDPAWASVPGNIYHHRNI